MKAILIDGDTGRSYNIAQLRAHSITFGQGLQYVLQWTKGDVLAFFTPNSIDTPVLNLGLLWAGGVASPANPTYTAEELARQLADCNAKALVTQKPFLEMACRAAEMVNLSLDNILLLGDGRDVTGKFRHWTDITAEGALMQPTKTAIDPEKDAAYLVYSSVRAGFQLYLRAFRLTGTGYNWVAEGSYVDTL